MSEAPLPTTGPEIWFYQLERSSLEQVLPELLGRTLQRGWRALVRIADAGRMAEIDERLWTFRDEAFLAHGRADGPDAERQPIVLTQGTENPNGARALFIIDGSEMGSTEGYERCFVLFDGRDETALHGARERWKALKGKGLALSYWQQTDEGWRKAA
ncbi:DNA polymerase III subunit chi [soil metagenome]